MPFAFFTTTTDVPDSDMSVTVRTTCTSPYLTCYTAILFGTESSCCSSVLSFSVSCTVRADTGTELNGNAHPLTGEGILNKFTDTEQTEKNGDRQLPDGFKHETYVTLPFARVARLSQSFRPSGWSHVLVVGDRRGVLTTANGARQGLSTAGWVRHWCQRHNS